MIDCIIFFVLIFFLHVCVCVLELFEPGVVVIYEWCGVIQEELNRVFEIIQEREKVEEEERKMISEARIETNVNEEKIKTFFFVFFYVLRSSEIIPFLQNFSKKNTQVRYKVQSHHISQKILHFVSIILPPTVLEDTSIMLSGDIAANKAKYPPLDQI